MDPKVNKREEGLRKKVTMARKDIPVERVSPDQAEVA